MAKRLFFPFLILFLDFGLSWGAIRRPRVISGHAIPKFDCSVNTEDLVVEAMGPLPQETSQCQSSVKETGLFALSCSLPPGKYRLQLKNTRTGFVDSALVHVRNQNLDDVSFDPCPDVE